MRGRALIIATSRYSDPQLRRLPACAADAAGLKEVFEDTQIGDFEVSTCLDRPWAEWRQRIGSFFTKASRDELLLVYISGHGVKDRDGKLYFGAADTLVDELLATGITASFIHEAMQSSRSQRMVLILDTCFSGAFARGLVNRDAQAVNTADYFREGTGTAVMAASGAIQYALEAERKGINKIADPSLFSGHVIAGLRSGAADIDGDGQVSVEDLFQYVSARVQGETGTQRPQRWYFGLDGQLIIAANPAPRPGKLSADVLELIASPVCRARMLAVEDLERLLAGQSRALALAAREALETLQKDHDTRVARAAAAVLREAGRASEPATTAGWDIPWWRRKAVWIGAAAAVVVAAVAVGTLVIERGKAQHAAHLPAASTAAAATVLGASLQESTSGSPSVRPSPIKADRDAGLVLVAQASRSTSRGAPPLSTRSDEPRMPAEGLAAMSPGTVFADCPECLEMVRVPGGSFSMGSRDGEDGGSPDQGPLHTVTISYPLAVSRYPVTRGQWRQYRRITRKIGSDNCYSFDWSTSSWEQRTEYTWRNPGYPQEDNHPVVCVTWREARDYAVWLSKRTGKRYRLLSEAEYEYINRAVTRPNAGSAYFWGDEAEDACRYANGADASLKARFSAAAATSGCDDGYVFTSPVGRFQPNGFGLNDTTGNVWSWVEDCYHKSYAGAPTDGAAWTSGGDCGRRVLRGGSWANVPRSLRAAYRDGLPAISANFNVGFRLARTN